MLHHVPYPIKFLKEMFRILKPGGKLIIQEAHCSVMFQLVTMIMRHEGFDFTKNVWDEKFQCQMKMTYGLEILLYQV